MFYVHACKGLFRLLRLGEGRTKYNDYLCSVIGIMSYAKGNNRLVAPRKSTSRSR